MAGCALIAVLSPIGSAGTVDANPFEYVWQPLAPGVWAGIRQDPFELPQEGNTVFVVTDRGVVVFDAGGAPVMGEAIVAKVRAVTDTPITDVVLSHWHGDHMRGLQAIVAAFPRVTIAAHAFTRDAIAGSADRWLKRRETMVPNIRTAVNGALSAGRDLSGRPLDEPERVWLERGLSNADELDRENRRTAYVVPNATFDGRLTLFMGDREIQFLHLGNAHTAGDVVMWLPKEKIVATGDVVSAPVPLMPSAYPNEFVDVLDRIRALGFATLVPGHGAVEHDATYLDLLADTIRTVTTQMKAFVAEGLAEDAAVGRLDFSSVRSRFTHNDPFLEHRFQDYVVASALPHAAYLAATGKTPAESF
jgi:glyoxylase-like metal-dependent hydrolase (beta-lactamase superfamily II)